MTYTEGLLIAFDQLVNAALGGWPDETLSSRCWREEQQGLRAWPRKLVDALFFWQGAGHCKRAYEAEQKRLQFPPGLRGA